MLHTLFEVTPNPHCSQRLHSWKVIQIVKPDVGHYDFMGRNGARRSKDTWNICKLMINKNENNCVHVIERKWVFLDGKCRVTEWGMVCGSWGDIRLGKEGLIFDSFTFLCMSLHIYLYGAMTRSISFFQPQTQDPYHLFKERVTVHSVSQYI